MRISDWSSDVCSSDLIAQQQVDGGIILKKLQRTSAVASGDHPIALGLQHQGCDLTGVAIIFGQQDGLVSRVDHGRLGQQVARPWPAPCKQAVRPDSIYPRSLHLGYTRMNDLERYRQLLGFRSEGVHELDLRGHLTQINASGCALLCIADPAAALGQPLGSFWPEHRKGVV